MENENENEPCRQTPGTNRLQLNTDMPTRSWAQSCVLTCKIVLTFNTGTLLQSRWIKWLIHLIFFFFCLTHLFSFFPPNGQVYFKTLLNLWRSVQSLCSVVCGCAQGELKEELNEWMRSRRNKGLICPKWEDENETRESARLGEIRPGRWESHQPETLHRGLLP